MGASDRQSGLVPGTLDMLILKTLALEPMHGYGIGARIEQISEGVFQVNAGSFVPAWSKIGEIVSETGISVETTATATPRVTVTGR